MALVEETASYLDGSGRLEAKKLERGAALVYATESMRLTTRLMQVASWLLLHRAVKEGEMTLAQANNEKSKTGSRPATPAMQNRSPFCQASFSNSSRARPSCRPRCAGSMRRCTPRRRLKSR
jgi:hypothetical protein